MELATFQLDDQQVTQTAKLCKLTSNGRSVSLVLTKQPVTTPFGPGNFDKTSVATRKSLGVQCNPQVLDAFREFDEWALAYLTEHADRLFKRGPLTREQITAMYHSPVSQKGDYPALLRCKINLEGAHACKFWTTGGEPRSEPSDWKSVEFIPVISIRHLWLTGAMCGFAIDITDLQVWEIAAKQYPF